MMAMPMLVLMASMCPKGAESTVFALVTRTRNPNPNPNPSPNPNPDPDPDATPTLEGGEG